MKEKKNFKIELAPHVLKALRETSGYSVEEVAKKLKTSEEKVNAIEEGKEKITIKQVKKLAEIYHRPIAAFFTDNAADIKKRTRKAYTSVGVPKDLKEKLKDLKNRTGADTYRELVEDMIDEYVPYKRAYI